MPGGAVTEREVVMSSTDSLDATCFGAIVDDVADAVIVVDPDARVLYANRAVHDLLGHEPGDLVGHSYEVLIPPELHEVHAGHHSSFMRTPAARPMGDGLVLTARHADGYDVDVSIALVPIRGSSAVAAVVRDVSTTHRLVSRLAATADILTAALAGESRRSVEAMATASTCGVVSADSAWLLAAPDECREPEVVATCGAAAWSSVCDELSDSGALDELVAATSSTERESATFDGRDRRYLVVPMHTTEIGGALVAGRSLPAPSFVAADADVLAEFADALSITLELIAARAELTRLRSMADHDRIARDLHDRVIQRLFATAMRLESAIGDASGVAAERMVETVDVLDEVNREIRSTIFNLRRSESGGTVRSAVAAEVDAVADRLGFAPTLRVAGVVDDDLSDDVALEIPSVVRELLSNVVRHARAETVDVSIAIDGASISVVVDDDGRGVTEPSSTGQGLANLRQRAHDRNGAFELIERDPGGLRAVWTIPLRGSGEHAVVSPERES